MTAIVHFSHASSHTYSWGSEYQSTAHMLHQCYKLQVCDAAHAQHSCNTEDLLLFATAIKGEKHEAHHYYMCITELVVVWSVSTCTRF